MAVLRYTVTLLFPALAVSAVMIGGWWSYHLPLVVFGLIPLLELVLPAPTHNAEDAVMRERADHWAFDGLLYLLVAIQVGLVALLVWRTGSGDMAPWEVVGAALSVGICCGSFGINLGHELGHRRNAFQQRLAKIALATSLYVHFFVEHNRGHHVRVATDDDPATSRRGEVLYAFWIRSVVMGYISAFKLEATRLRRRGKRVLSLDNEVLTDQLLQAAVVVGVVWYFGPMAAAAWALAAVVGILMLETVNYIEHYGLARQRRPSGRFEPVRPVHSWNANQLLGRVLLFELTRHSDHHAHPHRKFPQLRHFDEAPELPTGYPGTMVLATIPPLFFRVMHPRLATMD